MTPHEYAESLVPLAFRLAGAVRSQDRDQVDSAFAAVNDLPVPDGINPAIALAVTLAAAVDPTRDANELLDWTKTIDTTAAPSARRHTKHRPCAAGCGRPRNRGKLCYRCSIDLAHEVHPCRHPECDSSVWRDDYCGYHDHGIDWAAEDWYDEVAVDRLWSGHPTPGRLPTAPEVLELIARASAAGMTHIELAAHLRLSDNEFKRWRRALGHLDATEAAA